jgi:hypothetical protein
VEYAKRTSNVPLKLVRENDGIIMGFQGKEREVRSGRYGMPYNTIARLSSIREPGQYTAKDSQILPQIESSVSPGTVRNVWFRCSQKEFFSTPLTWSSGNDFPFVEENAAVFMEIRKIPLMAAKCAVSVLISRETVKTM